ncbi:hypothetical protein M0R36_03520 [bacterium]|nr:hypothetical protein [bacterium]
MKKPTLIILLIVIICVVAVVIVQGIKFHNKKQLQDIMADIHKYTEEGKGNHLMVTYDPRWVFKHEELNNILESNKIHYTNYIKYKIVKSQEGSDMKTLDDKILALYKKSK